MPLINTSVPNLIQGVSQQPDATRFDGQCEEQENALSSVADGLKKRPNTKHIARLMTTAINENSFVHFINRSESEKYVVISTGSKVQVWNLITGQEATIQGATGGYNTLSGDYLYSSDAREDLKALTVADNTFLLNTKQPVALSTTRTTPLEDQALVYIAQGDYKKEYAVTININLISGTAATATANLQRYEAWSTATKKYYRWRITSVTVNSQGQDYENNPEITFTSDTNTYTEATATGNINGAGNLTSINVSNQGSYNGKNWSADGNSWGVNPPTIGVTITSVGGTSNNVTLSSRIWSGDSNSATHASTDFIALLLNDVGSYQGHKYQDFNTLTSAGFHTYFDIVRTGGLIRFKKKSNWEGTFTIRTSDGLAGTGIKSVYKEVGSISDLPQQAFWGLQCKVTGDADLNQDDYYVKFKSNSGDFWGDGSWQETVGFDINKGMNPVTLPKVLIRTDENTFVYENIRIQDREAGDLDSNPDPSFVSNNINNMFFYKDRLGFLSNDTVTLSEAGLGSVTDDGRVAFNFYRNTVTSLLDSAPIGVTVSSTRVTDLESAVGFQENLVLFSRNGQFVMKGGDLLTPRTVSVMPVTNFEYNEQVAPLPLGSYIYYPFERGQYTGLREFSVNASNDTYDSIEVTEHIPAYIPSNISAMVGTTSEDIIALLSDNEDSSLYIYKYFWNNNQKVLSAWSKFTFTGEIRGIAFIESTLHLIITDNGETNLVEMPLESGLTDAAGYVTHLDNRVASTVTNGSSTINLPYTPDNNSVEVYTTDGLKLNCTNSGSTVTLSSPVSSDTDVWVGIPYTMKYTFSEQLFKAKAGNGKSPSNAAKMLIRNGSIYYDSSAYFKVKVTPKFRDTYENVFTPDVVGSSTIGSLSLDSGFYRFPVFTKPQDTTITIENESALPSTFQSAEFESFVHSRSNRYG